MYSKNIEKQTTLGYFLFSPSAACSLRGNYNIVNVAFHETFVHRRPRTIDIIHPSNVVKFKGAKNSQADRRLTTRTA